MEGSKGLSFASALIEIFRSLNCLVEECLSETMSLGYSTLVTLRDNTTSSSLTNCWAMAALLEKAVVTSSELYSPAASFASSSATVLCSVMVISRSVRSPDFRGMSRSRSLLGFLSSGKVSDSVIEDGRRQAAGIAS